MIKLLVLLLTVTSCESQRVMLINSFNKDKSREQFFLDYLDKEFKPNIDIEKVFDVNSNKCLGREEYGHRVFVCDFKKSVLVFSLHSGRIKDWEMKLGEKIHDSQSKVMRLHKEVVKGLEEVLGVSKVDVVESGRGFGKIQRRLTQD